MQIKTTRFGPVELELEDTIEFAAGMPGLEDCRQWVLLADGYNRALGWLQCTTRPEIALAVVSPRRFVPGYQLRVTSGDLAPLRLNQVRDAQVLVVVGKQNESITLNLKAPLVINLERRRGAQVINNLDEPVAYRLRRDDVPLRKSA